MAYLVSTKSPSEDKRYVGVGEAGDGVIDEDNVQFAHQVPSLPKFSRLIAASRSEKQKLAAEFFAKLEEVTESVKVVDRLDQVPTLGRLYDSLKDLPTHPQFWALILSLAGYPVFIDVGQPGGEAVIGRALLSRVQGGIELYERGSSPEEMLLLKWSFEDIFKGFLRDVPVFKHTKPIIVMLYIMFSEIITLCRKSELPRLLTPNRIPGREDVLFGSSDRLLQLAKQFSEKVRLLLVAEDPEVSEPSVGPGLARMPDRKGPRILRPKPASTTEGPLGWIESAITLEDVLH